MARIRLSIADIALDAPILFDTFDQKGRLLLSAGQIIRSVSQAEQLIEEGMFREEGSETAGAASIAAMGAGRTRMPVFDLVDEIRQELLDALLRPGEGFPRRMEILAGRVFLACELDADAALASLFVDRRGCFSIRQGVSTAVLSVILSHNAEPDFQVTDSAVAAALTMNLSILDLLDEFYTHKGGLNAAQKEQVFRHPEESIARLKALGVTDEVWLTTVRQHHEAYDGSGYPQKIANDAIHAQASIVAAAERYCAAVLERSYRSGAPQDAALDFITVKQKGAVHPGVASRLKRQIGTHPPGTLVSLANGETAMVVKRTRKAGQPMVRALKNDQRVLIEGFPLRSTADAACSITGVLPYELLDRSINPLTLWYDDPEQEASV
jgi:HD-GYP domain-containing protein (c-di-GMP phosphodiesterase class II)